MWLRKLLIFFLNIEKNKIWTFGFLNLKNLGLFKSDFYSPAGSHVRSFDGHHSTTFDGRQVTVTGAIFWRPSLTERHKRVNRELTTAKNCLRSEKSLRANGAVLFLKRHTSNGPCEQRWQLSLSHSFITCFCLFDAKQPCNDDVNASGKLGGNDQSTNQRMTPQSGIIPSHVPSPNILSQSKTRPSMTE